MSVMIGSARIDENGNISGGKAGDQNGKEVSTQEWYLHSKEWYVLRAKRSEVAEKIAQCMESACRNPNIGYDQNQNKTLYNVAKDVNFDCSKVNTKCETDCARLVRICILYAGVDVDDFYTGNLKECVLNTGEFILYTSDDYCRSSKKLKRGDILVTRRKGHVVVVLSDGDDTHTVKTVNITLPQLSKGSKGVEVSTLQTLLEAHHISVGSSGIDGDYGNDTKKAVEQYQEKYVLSVDGVCGKDTWTHLLTGK